MTITVLIPAYLRPKDLARCLEALKKQNRVPDEVLIVVRGSDVKTWTLLRSFDTDPLTVRTVTVRMPGQVAALNAGLDLAREDIIAITDDDTAPHPDWLARIEAHFRADPKVGGVGGRDWIYHGERLEDGARKVVGKLQWFGRVIGNHHLGTGGPREVDVLKGVNMSYRRAAIQDIRFDERLLGTGAQVQNDMAFSLATKRMGWKLIYDPAVAVDHYGAPRFDEDRRDGFNAAALSNNVHNETFVLLEHLRPLQKLAYLLWSLFVGTRVAYGLAQWLRFLPREGRLAGTKLRASLRGRTEGWKTWRIHGTQRQK
jgi:cellulose synthase/poly-beta-1,6-N-acetylglucosamine synthase-like glycosyltransferase